MIDQKKNMEQLAQHHAHQKDMLLKELEEYESSIGQKEAKENFVKSKMLEFMDDYYSQMKNQMGIDANYGIEEDDPKLEVVLHALRPNTTARNFKEFLARSKNFMARSWLQARN